MTLILLNLECITVVSVGVSPDTSEHMLRNIQVLKNFQVLNKNA